MTETRKYKANREDWGSIRALPSGRFQASYIGPDGERHKAALTYSTRTDARAWLSSIRTDIQRGKWKNPKTVSAETFAVYAETWISQRSNAQGQPLRPKTATEYRRHVAKGLSEFAGDKLSAITPARVRTWHANRIAPGTKTTAGAEARVLRAILNTAVEDGIIEVNPVPSKLTKSKTNRTFRPPTLEELAVLYDQIDDRYKLAVLIAAYGGLRLSEWRALRRRDIALIDGRYVIDVHRQAQYVTGRGWIISPPKSDRGIRMATLPTWITGPLTAHLNSRVGAFPDSLLFAPKGRSEFIHDSDFNKTWNAARDIAGVRRLVREHDLRSFGGSHLMGTAGASLFETRDFLGHSESTVTERHYIKKISDRAAELADKMPVLPPVMPPNVTKLPETGTGG
ncbi:MAG: tyrosine-type recombinase/integrase [Microcella pacifica]|uniref:Tyrosine-type recombinase/integrase n=1 Tax=Microcella pacifica TaxID=2591847 RepID=A0A9E5JN68_9MICO|nr:tyrosine-type recombinase/integrase [Microcella pacifica]NHF63749.1 tyrosine-type recombinase/integrase [Microcella pacifica]